MKRVVTGTLLVSTLIGLFAACGPQTIQTKVWMPPREGRMTKVKRLAILDFDGPWYWSHRDTRAGLRAKIEARINNIQVKGKPHFKVVDRHNMNRVLKEQNISLSENADPKTSARVGKLLGIDAFMTGRMNENWVRDSSYKKTKKKCKRRSKGKCREWEKVSVTCTKRTAKVEFVPKIVDINTGELLFSDTIVGWGEAKDCPGGDGIASKDAVFTYALNEALNQIATNIAPYRVTLSLSLKDADAPIEENATAASQFGGAMKFLKAGRMDRACKLFEDCHESVGHTSIAALYNLGICEETKGNPGEALKLYQQIDQMLVEPDDMVNSALTRAQKRVEEKQKVDEQVGE